MCVGGGGGGGRGVILQNTVFTIKLTQMLYLNE